MPGYVLKQPPPSAFYQGRDPVAPAPARRLRTTPPGTVPRWLTALFPSIDGIGESPLYIRLSGQGFCKRPTWYRGHKPRELGRARTKFFERLGFLPFVLMFLPPVLFLGLGWLFPRQWILVVFAPIFLVAYFGIPAGLVLFVIRILGLGSTSPVWRFLRNAISEPWGEDLYLAGISHREYGDSIFAAVIGPLPKRLLIAAALGLLMIALAFSILVPAVTPVAFLDLKYAGSPARYGWNIFQNFLAFGFPCALLFFLEIMMLAVLQTSLAIRSSLVSAQSKFGFARSEVRDFATQVLVHWPGLSLAFFAFCETWLFMSSDRPLLLIFLVFGLYVAMTIPFGYWIARRTLERSHGNLGKAFEILLRGKHEA